MTGTVGLHVQGRALFRHCSKLMQGALSMNKAVEKNNNHFQSISASARRK
jgi:hypothetical protein